MSDKELTNQELETEALLGSLAPRSVELNREVILYESGFAAAKKQSQNQVRLWMSLAACFAFVSLFSFSWSGSSETQVDQQIVNHNPPFKTETPPPKPKVEPIKKDQNPNSNFSLRQLAITGGVDKLPVLSNSFSITSGSHKSISNRKLLISMLNPQEQ